MTVTGGAMHEQNTETIDCAWEARLVHRDAFASWVAVVLVEALVMVVVVVVP